VQAENYADMPEKLPGDDVQARAAAAIKDADSGSNHQAGVGGDDNSVADKTGEGIPSPSHTPRR